MSRRTHPLANPAVPGPPSGPGRVPSYRYLNFSAARDSRGHAVAARQQHRRPEHRPGSARLGPAPELEVIKQPGDTAAPRRSTHQFGEARRHATHRRRHRPGIDLEHQNNAHLQADGRQRICPPGAFPQVNATSEAISRSTWDTPLSHATSDHPHPPRIVPLTCRFVSRLWESNPRPTHYESAAQPPRTLHQHRSHTPALPEHSATWVDWNVPG
jgi:hypothetical protein